MLVNRYVEVIQEDLPDWERLIVCPNLASEKPALLDYFERSFNNIIQSERLRNNFDWAFIIRFYNDQRNEFRTLWKLKIFLRFVLNLFCRFDCRETLLIKKRVHMYHEVLREYQTLYVCANCMQRNNPKHYLDEDIKDCFVLLSTVNEPPSQIYSFDNRDLYWRFSSYAVFQGDCVFLNFLVKYGLSYFPLYLEDLREEVKDDLEYMYELYREFRVGVQLAETHEFVVAVLSIIADIHSNFNFRKSVLTLKYVNVCYRRHQGDNCLDYISCLKLYVLTVPDAVVSVNDVEDFLHLIFGHDLTFRNEMLAVFNELFPENPRFCSPRSLQHLCRCKIRDCVRKYPSFPSVIAEMELSTILKNYLLVYEG